MSGLVKLCEECGLDYRRPTGTARMSDAAWAARRFCSAECGVIATGMKVGDANLVARSMFDTQRECATASCKAHLRALMKYGLNNDSDLAMGREAFMSTARSLGLVV